MERSTKLLPVPVVGVVRTPGPASAQFCKEAISSVLSTGMGSCSSGFVWVAGGVTNSGLGVGAGIVLGPTPGVPTSSVWMEKHAQLFQGLLHLQVIIDHAPHHLDARVGRRLLQAVVV